jgi:hypothetical protein
MVEFIEENEDIITGIAKISHSLNISFSAQNDILNSIFSTLEIIKRELDLDFSNREREFRELEHISRDIKDNFTFTLSIADEVKSIDEVLQKINGETLNLTLKSKDENVSKSSKSVREFSDEIKEVVNKIFTKEIRNKTFGEHNRYIRNSVVHRIDDELSSLKKYIESKDGHLKKLAKIERYVNSFNEIISQNMAMAKGIERLLDALTVDGEKFDFQSEKSEENGKKINRETKGKF